METKKRLIDADAVVKGLQEEIRKCEPVTPFDAPLVRFQKRVVPKLLQSVIDYLAYIPTVDAVPVVHGEWLLRHEGHGHYWECSVCHTNPCIYVTKDTKFCPSCGAKMDGDGNG